MTWCYERSTLPMDITFLLSDGFANSRWHQRNGEKLFCSDVFYLAIQNVSEEGWSGGQPKYVTLQRISGIKVNAWTQQNDTPTCEHCVKLHG